MDQFYQSNQLLTILIFKYHSQALNIRLRGYECLRGLRCFIMGMEGIMEVEELGYLVLIDFLLLLCQWCILYCKRIVYVQINLMLPLLDF